MKRIGPSDIIGERGIAHIRQVVLSMGFMFYETGGVEAGIDGFIELRDEASGIVGNQILQIQGKASEKQRLQAETDESFEFLCNDADISYWKQGTAPVLLIVVRLNEGKAYWKSIKSWFSDPDHLKSRKVVFNKFTDEFTRDTKAAIAHIAATGSPGATAPSIRKTEQLLINLLPVEFARMVYWAPTSHRSDKTFGAALRELDKKAGSEWIVRSKSVLSFHQLDEWPWSDLCESEAMEEFGTDEWSESDDEDRQRDFVALLNRALGEFVRPALWHDRETGLYYFRKPARKDVLNFPYRSLSKTTTRRVVGHYGKQKADPSKPAYWRHSAFGGRFVLLNAEWFLEVTPTYHFTRDGLNDDKFAGEHLKKIKEMENNAAVMGQFVMWREFLSNHRADDLYADRYPFIWFGELQPLELAAGVTDELWKSQEVDPASPLFDFGQVDGVL